MHRNLVFGVLAMVLAGAATPASAVPILYTFTASAAGGPLAGSVFAGSLTVDSVVAAAGGGPLLSIEFSLLGVTFGAADDAFGLLPQASFAPQGDLTAIYSFVVISPARAAELLVPGGTAMPAPVSSFSLDGGFSYGVDATRGEVFSGGIVAGHPVPEPASALMLLTGCVSFLSWRCGRRRNEM